MNVYERLLKYVVIRTPSNEESDTTPSSQCQFDLANVLKKEMEDLGICNVILTDSCFLYGKIPATPGYENAPAIGFIAHMDTSPEVTGKDVNPQIVIDYDGSDIILNEKENIILSPKDFPELLAYKGQDIITTDGTTLLGADDKAGIAEIMTMADYLMKHSNIKHGTIKIAFTPDEEVGGGADYLKLSEFGAVYGYTLDGSHEGEIQFENFNAAGAKFTVTGFNVHPGSAKDTMINAIAVASEIQSLLPEAESPRNTDGYEGFYHLTGMSGDVAHAESEYIIRDHDAEKFAAKEENLRRIEEEMNEKYGAGTVKLEIKEQYRNMSEKIRPCYHLIENAEEAARRAGMEPIILPIRGGTDGARLSFMGLPCPNLGTGGYAYHGPYEHITVEGMELAVAMLKELVKIYAE